MSRFFELSGYRINTDAISHAYVEQDASIVNGEMDTNIFVLYVFFIGSAAHDASFIAIQYDNDSEAQDALMKLTK
jgi:hypothetical protein